MFIPSIVPAPADIVYIVEDDFGPKLGRVYRETDAAQADRETVLSDLYGGQHNDPVRVVAFNTREGWSRDVSYEFASELQRRADLEGVEPTGDASRRPLHAARSPIVPTLCLTPAHSSGEVSIACRCRNDNRAVCLDWSRRGDPLERRSWAIVGKLRPSVRAYDRTAGTVRRKITAARNAEPPSIMCRRKCSVSSIVHDTP